jgi:apolipoprotein N-acyltransferase
VSRRVTAPAFATIASATLYALSFPPAGLAPLAWVALVPFLVVASRLRPGPGAVWGTVLGALGVFAVAWWFPGMVARYFEISPVLGGLGLAVAAVTLAGVYYGLFAAWVAWLVARGGASPLLVAAGWTATEFARANVWVGNPWALAGYSQVVWPRLMQIADATGPYGPGFLIAAVNACVAAIWAPGLRGRRPLVSAGVVGLMLVATLAYGTWRLGQPFASGEPVEVAVVQGAVTRELRRRPEGASEALDRYLSLTRTAVAEVRPALVLWPENAVEFYLEDASAERERLLGTVRDLDTDLVLGGPSYVRGAEGLRYHNSVYLIRNGSLAGRYDKRRLLPIAEWRSGETIFSPGRTVYGLRAAAGLVGAFVCSEALYPDVVRRVAMGGAEILANLSNDAWFGHAAPARHHLDIASVRAIENRRYLVRATSTGFSAVVDPHGRIVAQSALGATDLLASPVRRANVRTPYHRWGDAAAWVAIAVAAAGTLLHLLAARPKGETT